jgi:hypothetical protein
MAVGAGCSYVLDQLHLVAVSFLAQKSHANVRLRVTSNPRSQLACKILAELHGQTEDISIEGDHRVQIARDKSGVVEACNDLIPQWWQDYSAASSAERATASAGCRAGRYGAE